ncbi:uncharacterized protein LOC127705690 [Mytilus californianus]|uniref:uncharacterized protein LOC127705690 n=1 Tax=Mytilus californianus TaxID=6549 RepID=UPI002246C6A4|nr:uncharacterized protein LOC127705690 [Mytilus californianus]
MDDYSIKVISWIGISMIITYRRYFLSSTEKISKKEEQITYRGRKPYDGVSESIRKNIEKLSVSIKEDTDFLITWIKGVEQTSAIWKTGETKTLPESIKFQMVSVNGESAEVVYRIIVLPKPTADKEALIKQIKENEENVIVCDKEENDTLTEWISDNKETIIKSIGKDTITFIGIIKGDNKLSDDNIRQDIDILTKIPWLSCRGMFRHYSIILSKTTSNKETSTECILQDKETSTECILQDKETSTECILQDKETSTECKLQDKETSTEYILQDKATSTEYILQDKETSMECILQNKDADLIQPDNKPPTYCLLHNTLIERIQQGSEPPTECILEDKETMTEGSLQDKKIMTAQTTHMRELFEPGCPSALDITPTTITLTWDDPIVGADCYEIKCEQKNISVVSYYKTSVNSCKYIVKGLKRNTEYELTIQAVKNEVNKGPYSKALKVSTSAISNYSIAEFLYVLFYIVILIWFSYLFCYIVFIK